MCFVWERTPLRTPSAPPSAPLVFWIHVFLVFVRFCHFLDDTCVFCDAQELFARLYCHALICVACALPHCCRFRAVSFCCFLVALMALQVWHANRIESPSLFVDQIELPPLHWKPCSEVDCLFVVGLARPDDRSGHGTQFQNTLLVQLYHRSHCTSSKMTRL